ncbi:MAG: hypothetical protein V1792_09180 [Pseudomonadota bacterium]
MGACNPQLVVLDFPGIKRFVFGTDRLVEIRGASALLDRLNRDVIPQFISEKYGSKGGRCVFAGGGAGQFIIEDTLENIHRTFHEIQGEVHRQSGGLLHTIIGVAPLNGDFRTALDAAFLDLQANKFQRPFDPSPGLHTGFVRECDSCSGMACEVNAFSDETRILCKACAQKQKMGWERGLWNKFSDYLKIHEIHPEQSGELRPKDFEEIGSRCRTKRGYTALVYGDGNAIGKLVKQIGKEEEFGRFSAVLDNSVREACHEALWRHCPVVDGKIPADILLLGGDDLMVYMSADNAMPFAIDVARLFEQKTREALLKTDQSFLENKLGGRGLTISIGIAYGKSHTPISIMVDQAEEVLNKSAKKRGSALVGNDAYTPPCIDFHLTGHFNQASVADSRRHHLTFRTPRGEEVHLYRGPYTLEEAEALLEHAGNLVRSGIPRSRLHRMRDAPFKGKINGTLEMLTLYNGCRTTEQKQTIWKALDRFDCLPVMPWRVGEIATSTVLVDLLEIADLMRSPGKDSKHDSSHSS